MGFSYLNGKDWIDVTRGERIFCSYLYGDIKGKEKDFVAWLNENSDLALIVDDNWEVGYEVCFYRDVQKLREGLPDSRYSKNRTFDLCLFSENAIVVIEAKVQHFFKEREILEFQKDRTNIPKITAQKLDVFVVALASSKYFKNYDKYGRRGILSKPNFNTRITWKQMSGLYNNNREIYLRADLKYKN